MLAVAVTLTALLALVVALLAVPVVFAIDVELTDRLSSRWHVQWLFGLVVTGADSAATPRRPRRIEPTRVRAARPVKQRPGRNGRIAVAVLRTRGLLPRIMRLAADLRRQVALDRFQVRAAFGLENPADTGSLYGSLSPLLVAADVRGLDVQCRPEFERVGVTGTLRATMRVRPLALGARVVMFAVSPPVRQAALNAWRAR